MGASLFYLFICAVLLSVCGSQSEDTVDGYDATSGLPENDVAMDDGPDITGSLDNLEEKSPESDDSDGQYETEHQELTDDDNTSHTQENLEKEEAQEDEAEQEEEPDHEKEEEEEQPQQQQPLEEGQEEEEQEYAEYEEYEDGEYEDGEYEDGEYDDGDYDDGAGEEYVGEEYEERKEKEEEVPNDGSSDAVCYEDGHCHYPGDDEHDHHHVHEEYNFEDYNPDDDEVLDDEYPEPVASEPQMDANSHYQEVDEVFEHTDVDKEDTDIDFVEHRFERCQTKLDRLEKRLGASSVVDLDMNHTIIVTLAFVSIDVILCVMCSPHTSIVCTLLWMSFWGALTYMAYLTDKTSSLFIVLGANTAFPLLTLASNRK